MSEQESVIYQNSNDRADADSVTLARILDVLYALLYHRDEKTFKKLADLHAEGGIMGPVPNFDPNKILDNGEK